MWLIVEQLPIKTFSFYPKKSFRISCRAKSNEQRAKRNEQRATSKELSLKHINEVFFTNWLLYITYNWVQKMNKSKHFTGTCKCQKRNSVATRIFPIIPKAVQFDACNAILMVSIDQSKVILYLLFRCAFSDFVVFRFFRIDLPHVNSAPNRLDETFVICW